MFEVGAPRTGDEVLEGWTSLHREITELVEALGLEEFHSPQGEHWSPAQHLRHLVTSNRALSQGMKVPRFLLALRFGLNRRGSRSFGEVRDLYRRALAEGGRASGRYDPSLRAIDKPPGQLRELVLGRWRASGSELEHAIRAWPERALDRYQAKHPLLGNLSARELLFFTLYHNAHHARRIVERRAG